MAGDKTDGCMPSKMVSQEEMETEMSSQAQQSDLSPPVGRHWFNYCFREGFINISSENYWTDLFIKIYPSHPPRP